MNDPIDPSGPYTASTDELRLGEDATVSLIHSHDGTLLCRLVTGDAAQAPASLVNTPTVTEEMLLARIDSIVDARKSECAAVVGSGVTATDPPGHRAAGTFRGVDQVSGY